MRILFLSVSLFLVSCGNTVYVVRHAEKAVPVAGSGQVMTNDPPLTEAGKKRAFALRDKLKNKNIRYLFSTNTKRTIATAQPLSDYAGHLRIDLYSSRKDSTAALIEKIKSIRSGNVLLVGHSNTIDDIANALCGSTVVPGDLEDAAYDHLYIIRRRGGRYKFRDSHYGVRTN